MPRARALALLEEVDRGRRLDVAWEAAAPALDPRGRGWVHEAVFGVCRLRGRLDHLLSLHLHRGIDSVPVPLLRVLRLGAFQLLYMGSVPGYAAVSETVAQARGVGGRKGAGLVNAVLRALADAGGGVERFPVFESDPIGYLSTWGSHPRWLVERWVESRGAEVARGLTEAGNRVPDLYVRPVGIAVQEAGARLRDADIAFEAGPAGSRTLRLPRGTDVPAVLACIPAIVQDPAASRVVDWVRAECGDRVVDLCAAPGGKGIGLAGDGAWVAGSDPSAARLSRMRESLRRLELPERLVVARGEAAPFAPVEIVLVDAPCSGTGTLARHPDARWRLGPDAPGDLARVQREILAGAAPVVRPGGRLVYATCTLEPEENEDVVTAFLEAHPGFERDGTEAVLEVLPGAEEGTDGAYAVRMRRKS